MSSEIFSIRPESKPKRSFAWIGIITYLGMQIFLTMTNPNSIFHIVGLGITTILTFFYCLLILRDMLTSNQIYERPNLTVIKWIISVVLMMTLVTVIPIIINSLHIVIDYGNQEVINALILNGDFFTKLIMLVMVVIIGPIIEEYLFRYLMIGNSKTWIRPTISIIIFTIAHITLQPTIAAQIAIIAQYSAISISLVFIYKYYKNNAIASLLVHIGYNTLATIPVIVAMFSNMHIAN